MVDKSSNHIFFLCSGFGLGNAARISAIIDRLRLEIPEKNIHLITWGRALSFFKQHPDFKHVNILGLYSYLLPKKLKVENYLLTFLLMMFFFPIKYIKNTILIYRYLSKHEVCMVVFDSDYHFVPFLFQPRTFKISLNQSYNVLANYFQFGFRKKIEMFPSFLIEMVDALLQLIFIKKIYVPTIGMARLYPIKKLQSLPLIVRDVFLKKGGELISRPLGVCVGGSGLEVKELVKSVNAREFDLLQPEGHDLHKNVLPVPRIMSYDKLVCQGGLSTLSEVLASGRSFSVIPIKSHCEQYSNFLDVEKIPCKKTFSKNLDNFRGSQVIVDEILVHFS